TAEFVAGLEARSGPVPSLDEAEEAMRSACAELEQKDVQAGSELEETALAGLIKARMNLRKILSDSSGSSASACRQFDTQQDQRLRRPPEQKDDQAQLAQLQKQIEQLAEQEKRFSEEIAAKGSGGAQLDPSGQAPPRSQPSGPAAAQPNDSN